MVGANGTVESESRCEINEWLAAAATKEPSPVEAAVLVDQIEVVLRDLPKAYCQILALRLEGYSPTNVASKMSISRQTVYRALRLMQQRLKRDMSETTERMSQHCGEETGKKTENARFSE